MASVEALKQQKGEEALGTVVKVFGSLVFVSELESGGLGTYPLTDAKGNTLNTSFVSPGYMRLDKTMEVEIPENQEELLATHKKPAIFYLQKYYGKDGGEWARKMLEVLLPKFRDPEGGLSLKENDIGALIDLLFTVAKEKGIEDLDKLTPANFTFHRIIAQWEPLMIGERLIINAPNQSEHEGSLYLNSFGGEVFKWDKEGNGWVRLKDSEDLWTFIEPYLKSKIALLK